MDLDMTATAVQLVLQPAPNGDVGSVGVRVMPKMKGQVFGYDPVQTDCRPAGADGDVIGALGACPGGALGACRS